MCYAIKQFHSALQCVRTHTHTPTHTNRQNIRGCSCLVARVTCVDQPEPAGANRTRVPIAQQNRSIYTLLATQGARAPNRRQNLVE